jgi:hypothetical protein
MYNLGVFACSVAILTSLGNADWHLCGVAAMLPSLIALNLAGGMVILWAWDE